MQYYLDNYLSGITKAEAFEMFGLDWSIYATPTLTKETENTSWSKEVKIEGPDENGRVREFTRISLPGRVLTQTVERDKYLSPWIIEYLCKEKEDIFEFLEHKPGVEYDFSAECWLLGELGNKGIMRGCCVGPWHELCDLYGTEFMIYATFDDPEWVKNALDAMTEDDLGFLATMKGARVDLLETGGGHNSSTVISPKIFEEFVLPREKRIHDFIGKELGLRSVYHTCGGMMPILDLLVEVGSTAIETLTPTSMGGDVNLAEVKRRVGDKVCLIGNVNCALLDTGTDEEVIESARYALKHGMPGGGYVFSTSNCI